MVGWMCFNAAFQWLSLHFAYMNIHVLMELSYIFQWHYAAKVHGLSRWSLSHIGPSEYMNNTITSANVHSAVIMARPLRVHSVYAMNAD